MSAIRRDPRTGPIDVRLRPGEAAVLLGGVVAHRLTPLAEGHVRIVAPLCCQAAL